MDALQYMADSGDPLLQTVAEWMWWAPGIDTVSDEERKEFEGHPICETDYSAACALRDEMGHVDHYDDMSINIDAHLIAAACASTPLVGEYFCALYGKLAELGGLQGKVGSLPYFNLGDNRTGYGAYTITSLNHFIGAYYAADLVPRMNQCEGREAQERLGYRYKWLEGDCGEFSQGDCHNENETMGGLAALTTDSNYSDAVSLGFCPALLNYNGLTCHTHDVHPGDSVSGAEYIPLDNMVEYWMDQWGASTDIVKLAPALHASQDVFVPHHNYLYMGRGHGMFESWSQGRAIESFLCRNGVTDPQHCSPYSFNEFYHPDTIRAFLQRWYPGQEAIGEGLTTDIAEESAWAPLAGMGVPALSLAIRWQAENSYPFGQHRPLTEAGRWLADEGATG